MDVLKFIRSVEQRECIYNKSSADYRNRDVVFDSWRSIAREMNISVIECKEKWHNLRSNYMRERKKQIFPGVKRWHLLDSLSFLESHYCARGPSGPRRRSRRQSTPAMLLNPNDTINEIDDFGPSTPQNNVSSTEQFNLDDINDDEMQNPNFELCNKIEIPSISENDLQIDMNSRSPVPPLKIRRKGKRHHPKWDDIDREYLKQVRKLTRHLNQPAEDPDRMFLLSLLPLVKQLSPSDNLNFRVEVQQILQTKLRRNL